MGEGRGDAAAELAEGAGGSRKRALEWPRAGGADRGAGFRSGSGPAPGSMCAAFGCRPYFCFCSSGLSMVQQAVASRAHAQLFCNMTMEVDQPRASRAGDDVAPSARGDPMAMFDLEIDDDNVWSPTSKHEVPLNREALMRDVYVLGAMCSPVEEEEALLKDVLRLVASNTCAALDSQDRLAAGLKAMGWPGVEIRCSKPGKKSLRTPKRTFLVVGDALGSDLIVDTNFPENFAVARPTAYYAELYDALPQIFVGSQYSLKSLVGFMSKQLQKSFEDTGMPCPPWREHTSLLNAWAL